MFIIRTTYKGNSFTCEFYLIKRSLYDWRWTCNLIEASEFHNVEDCAPYIAIAGVGISYMYTYPEAIDANILWHDKRLKENKVIA